jgi:hypothetical protein
MRVARRARATAAHEFREGLAAIDALPPARQGTEAMTALRTELTGRLETRMVSPFTQIVSELTIGTVGRGLVLGAILVAACLLIVRRKRGGF